ncbi:MAG TPA: bifunctional (p)ppGpp synthetase/guanosine-3',5'-bis(diphosphate) 3'-pyrophosphohydrolase [Burkholderiales bacterium]|nr:bifunctional (p)ppGpp synthetase/guanosine-3',5'-bis(diphosphate) 3'-pyrophosphohydrolase [Burkholderiales bacterium]
MSTASADPRAGPEASFDSVAVLAQLTSRLSEPDQALVARALDFARDELAQQRTADGEPALDHAVGTAGVLTGLPLAGSAVAAALLHDMPDFIARSQEKLRETVSPDVASLVDGVARMGQIQALTGGVAAGTGREDGAQLEGLRKMLLAMVQDIRVVLIKLAEQTQRLRFLVKRGEEDRRRAAARETLDLLAPLANRLGVWQFKWELEDLSFRILEPGVYKDVARQLDEKRVDRERYIEQAIATLKGELAAAGIAADISGRPKHIYSIWKKMRRKSVDFAEVYDARALRVLVPEVRDCYTALGIVHNLWVPLPREFDDYIAKPKPNGYRSLHTAVIGPDGRVLEVQIRTHDMHRHAELGVAAHWRYKEGGGRDSSYDDKIAWLRQILEWPDEVPDSAEIAAQFKTELFRDTVYVFTPHGQVIALPRGATPVDFAYHVHSELGHRCRGAKVNGAMVPLNYALSNGQRVEVLAAKSGGPSRDWLNPLLGYIVSARARAKVRQWFNNQNLQSALALGRATVEREAHRVGVALPALDALAQRLGFGKVEDCLVAVGRGEIGVRQLQAALRGENESKAQDEASIIPGRSRATDKGGGILVVGVENLLTALGKCCKPAPPDEIIGFVTRGRGVTVHRRDCRNLRSMPDERMIAAEWGRTVGEHFPIDIRIEARDRQGLLRDISEILSRERINVTATDTLSRGDFAVMGFTVEVEGVDQLARVLGYIRDVAGVTRAERS